jgi:hypothetical protein
MVERYGADMPVPDWHKRLVCSACGKRRRAQAHTDPRLWDLYAGLCVSLGSMRQQRRRILGGSGSHEIDFVVTGANR